MLWGLTHWRLHLLVLASTFVLFPVLGLTIAALPASERFHWLTQPSSALIQTSPVHSGLGADPAELQAEIDRSKAMIAAEAPGTVLTICDVRGSKITTWNELLSGRTWWRSVVRAC